jgi:TolA-binding protein
MTETAMKSGYLITAALFATAATPIQAQEANIEGRVVKLEKEMKSVQRRVFPDGAGRFIEPDIRTEAAKPAPVGTPSSTAVSDLIARVDALETQLATLTGQVETQAASMRAMDSRLKAIEAQLKEAAATAAVAAAPAAEVTPKEVAPKVAVAAPKPATPATKPAAPAAKPTAATKAPVVAKPSAARTAAVAAIERPKSNDAFEDSYSYGYRLWEAKFYPEAQVQLQDTVSKFPKHARSSYARNLLGRAWLDDGKPATAVKIFYDNYKNDPRGDRAPDSLYFLGDALTELGKAAEACEAFAQLTSAYPADSAGRLASRLVEGRKKAKCK